MTGTVTDRDALTERQAAVFRWVFEQLCEKGYQPTLAEVAARFGMAGKPGARNTIVAIERKGWWRINERAPRAITFLRRPDGGRFVGLTARADDEVRYEPTA